MAVTQLSEADVLAVLAPVKDPELGRTMIELKMIQDVVVIDPQTIGMRVVLNRRRRRIAALAALGWRRRSALSPIARVAPSSARPRLRSGVSSAVPFCPPNPRENLQADAWIMVDKGERVKIENTDNRLIQQLFQGQGRMVVNEGEC